MVGSLELHRQPPASHVFSEGPAFYSRRRAPSIASTDLIHELDQTKPGAEER